MGDRKFPVSTTQNHLSLVISMKMLSGGLSFFWPGDSCYEMMKSWLLLTRDFQSSRVWAGVLMILHLYNATHPTLPHHAPDEWHDRKCRGRRRNIFQSQLELKVQSESIIVTQHYAILITRQASNKSWYLLLTQQLTKDRQDVKIRFYRTIFSKFVGWKFLQWWWRWSGGCWMLC